MISLSNREGRQVRAIGKMIVDTTEELRKRGLD